MADQKPPPIATHPRAAPGFVYISSPPPIATRRRAAPGFAYVKRTAEQMANQNTEMPSRKMPRIEDFVAKYHKVPVSNEFQKFSIKGMPHKVSWLRSEGEEHDDYAFHTAINRINQAESQYDAGGYYASALAIAIPDLGKTLRDCLIEKNVSFNIITIPKEAAQNMIDDDPKVIMSTDEIIVYTLCMIILCFKHVGRAKFDNYYKSIIKAFFGKLGYSDEEDAYPEFPINLSMSLKIRACFAGNYELKQQMILYLLWACNQEGGLKLCARYACEIISYTELTSFCLITNFLVNSRSPVLQNPHLLGELRAYYLGMQHICASDYPQFFGVFCTTSQEEYLQRNKFKTLATIAERISEHLRKGNPTSRYVPASHKENQFVVAMVNKHLDYLNREEAKAMLGFVNH